MSDYPRPECGCAHFAGDVRSTFDDTPHGPGYDGEFRWVLATEYDEAMDVTTVTYTKTPPEGSIHANIRGL